MEMTAARVRQNGGRIMYSDKGSEILLPWSFYLYLYAQVHSIIQYMDVISPWYVSRHKREKCSRNLEICGSCTVSDIPATLLHTRLKLLLRVTQTFADVIVHNHIHKQSHNHVKPPGPDVHTQYSISILQFVHSSSLNHTIYIYHITMVRYPP